MKLISTISRRMILIALTLVSFTYVPAQTQAAPDPMLVVNAVAGDANAQCDLGYYYEQAGQHEVAAMLYALSGDNGNAAAQYNLGGCYYYGRGVNQDYAKAAHCYKLSADQGDADAQNSLGLCYLFGYGVDKDEAMAVKLFELAAAQDDFDGKYNLANCLLEGIGAERDYNRAYKMFVPLAEGGDAQSQYNLAICLYNGWGVKKDQKQARIWMQRAADQNLDIAKDALARGF